MRQPVILASASSARASLLRHAGVRFSTEAARIDEDAIKDAMVAEAAPPRDIADKLAEWKSMRVSSRNPDALIIGADQVLVANGQLHNKPPDVAAARKQLLTLRGKTHELLSAAVISDAGKPVWRHVGRAQMVMRPFSDVFLDEYLATEGDALLDCVGGYRLEGLGAQLFARVQGDYFSVLGLPLLELLGFLRARGVLTE